MRDKDYLASLLEGRSPTRPPAEQRKGISPLDVLDLPAEQRKVMNALMRIGSATVSQVAQSIGIGSDRASELLNVLVEKGFLHQSVSENQSFYEPLLGHHRRPRLSSTLWEKLQE